MFICLFQEDPSDQGKITPDPSWSTLPQYGVSQLEPNAALLEAFFSQEAVLVLKGADESRGIVPADLISLNMQLVIFHVS